MDVNWLTVNIPSKKAGSEPGKHFGSSHYGQCAAKIGPDRILMLDPTDFLHPGFSVPFFQRRYGLYCAEPTRIRSGWPGQGLTKLISSGSKLVCRTHRPGPVSGRMQPVRCQFPTFRLGSGCSSTFVLDNKSCAKPARIRFNSGWLCKVLAKQIRSGSKSVCKNHPARFWPIVPSRSSGPDANQISHVYWVPMEL